mmetsp:Transcript_139708/g.260562  ORF Transcript_139708/g.260562 Transcript_139708/m.260562 type:complete len:422 (+) Transcript_139708:37-1302(+)
MESLTEAPAEASRDVPAEAAQDRAVQKATAAGHMALGHSPALTTPQVKRTRRTSQQKWFARSNPERRHENGKRAADEDMPAAAAADGETAVTAAAALAALQDYRAQSASLLQEYRGVQQMKGIPEVPTSVLTPPGECTAPLQRGDSTCRILVGDNEKVLVQAASNLVVEAWQASSTDQARVLVLLPRSRLLLWYPVYLTWDRVHGIPVQAFVSDASQSPGQLNREDDGKVGVCLAIDALSGDAECSASETASVPTPPSGTAADAAPLSADQRSRRRKRRRPSHSVDDDDSGNDTPSAAKQGTVAGTAAPSLPSAVWDLVVVDSTASGSQDTTSVLDIARSFLRGAVPKRWLILQAAAPAQAAGAVTRGDASEDAIPDGEQHQQRTLNKVPTPLRLTAERSRQKSSKKEHDDVPTSPGQFIG